MVFVQTELGEKRLSPQYRRRLKIGLQHFRLWLVTVLQCHWDTLLNHMSSTLTWQICTQPGPRGFQCVEKNAPNFGCDFRCTFWSFLETFCTHSGCFWVQICVCIFLVFGCVPKAAVRLPLHIPLPLSPILMWRRKHACEAAPSQSQDQCTRL